jgi:simple sugar transport system ATP-binding protein/ribose transport system ATP-binding protein
LSIERGTIHGLVGENGAGKSTLGKIISGVIAHDDGELVVNGRTLRYGSPRDALDDGVTIIAQELALVPEMSVAGNVFLGVEPGTAGIVGQRRLRGRYADLNRRAGFNLPMRTPVAELRLADQQKVEILRALARDASLIVMDEPTAALTTDEAQRLGDIVRNLKARGVTIVYVSHFLEEVLELADMVTVLKDGHVVRTAPAAEESPDKLVRAMLGRSLELTFPPKPAVDPKAPVALEVDRISRGRSIRDVSLNVRQGEIVGLAGLVGSGRTEVARVVYGADRTDSGAISVGGRPVKIRSPRDALAAGIALLPEDRKRLGLLMERSVVENVTLPHLDWLSRLGFVVRRREWAEAHSHLAQLDVRYPHGRTPVAMLSGGNQQKVMFARWLFRPPQVLLADEPTRGIDVGAKLAIYNLIASLAVEGMGVLLISSELEEVLGLAHRVYVMRAGEIVAEFAEGNVTEDAVMRAAFGDAAGASQR